jgi:transcriptional regulator with XRE-family HTH domain
MTDPVSRDASTVPQDRGSRAGPMRFPDVEERMAALGEFIRERRNQARLSLRKLSEQAGISNPYLSQIERGLRKPSAEILQAIARALRISAETLYVQAGILEDRADDRSVTAAIYADTSITERQKQTLVDIYESFRREKRSTLASDDHPDETG